MAAEAEGAHEAFLYARGKENRPPGPVFFPPQIMSQYRKNRRRRLTGESCSVNNIGVYILSIIYEQGRVAALQPVGAEDDAGALAHPIRALQTGDTVVVVNFFLRHIFLRRHLPRFFAIYYCIAFFGF